MNSKGIESGNESARRMATAVAPMPAPCQASQRSPQPSAAPKLNLRAGNSGAKAKWPGTPGAESTSEAELSFYRERTRALLRRYFRLSLETGRLPSLLGREFFRARVTSYRLHTFEDAVIFTHDVERCLERLDDTSKQLLARIVLQGHTEQDTAGMMGCTRRHVVRLYPEALDRLTAIFLEFKLLVPEFTAGEQRDAVRPARRRMPRPPEACQGAEIAEVFACA